MPGPQRYGRRADEVTDGWAKLEAGVDTKAKLSEHLRPRRTQGQLHEQPEHLPALGHPAGQGRARRCHAGRAARAQGAQ